MITTELTAVTDLAQICIDTIRMASTDAAWGAKPGEATGIHHFGASTATSARYGHVGITPERVAQSGRHW
jgi:transketolase